jgi:hypothetical protein
VVKLPKNKKNAFVELGDEWSWVRQEEWSREEEAQVVGRAVPLLPDASSLLLMSLVTRVDSGDERS